MRTREFGFVAVSRFMAVERYRETCPPSSTHLLQGSGHDRTGGQADRRDRTSGASAPARPEHG
jgi:hypothetical protein